MKIELPITKRAFDSFSQDEQKTLISAALIISVFELLKSDIKAILLALKMGTIAEHANRGLIDSETALNRMIEEVEKVYGKTELEFIEEINQIDIIRLN